MEPPTVGSISIYTSFGEFIVELWSLQCPLSTQRLFQRILEGYYTDLAIDHIQPNLIAQTAFRYPSSAPLPDASPPLADDELPLSPDEFHSRLKWNRRGLVGLVSVLPRPDSNGAAFFVTLGACPHLQERNTLIGRVSNETKYIPLKLDHYQLDATGRPLHPPKILRIDILPNPAHPIQLPSPREEWKRKNASDSTTTPSVKSKTNAIALTSNPNLLSFSSVDDYYSTSSSTSSFSLLPKKSLLEVTSLAMPPILSVSLDQSISMSSSTSTIIAPSSSPSSSPSPSSSSLLENHNQPPTIERDPDLTSPSIEHSSSNQDDSITRIEPECSQDSPLSSSTLRPSKRSRISDLYSRNFSPLKLKKIKKIKK